jgi:hypothetical protein
MYLRQPCRDYLKAAVDLVFLLHVTERRREDGTSSRSTGDILLFLPTAECVDQCLRLIQDRQDELYDHMSQGVSSAAVDDSLIALPLYSALPAFLQARVFLSAEELFLARAGHSVDAVRAGFQIEQTAKHARKLVVATAFAGKYSAIPLCISLSSCWQVMRVNMLVGATNFYSGFLNRCLLHYFRLVFLSLRTR